MVESDQNQVRALEKASSYLEGPCLTVATSVGRVSGPWFGKRMDDAVYARELEVVKNATKLRFREFTCKMLDTDD